MFLACFSANSQRKINLINAFKTICRDDSFKLCSKIVGFLEVLGGRAHACARARASEKLRATRFGTCRVPYHEALVRASGKESCPGLCGPSRPNLTVSAPVHPNPFPKNESFS